MLLSPTIIAGGSEHSTLPVHVGETLSHGKTAWHRFARNDGGCEMSLFKTGIGFCDSRTPGAYANALDL